MQDFFHKVAAHISYAVGTAWSFIIALLLIGVWLITGPIFHFSDTWQLIINTGTTIITFLMVFLIQNTQNRDAKAINLKLDELLRAHKGARTGLVNIEEISDKELEELQDQFRELHEHYSTELKRRKKPKSKK